MDIKQLVKEAGVEVSEAKSALKDKRESIAKACMMHLRDLITAYLRK